ncbi:hypothetical protein C8F04DRAFT_1177133 [Mycena alexandri]|uniref:Uncharacterized protein n=1 Tax=Mycena alexandri TaxID=1745969 RepID=A0AAD6X6Y0_9AGAR|nr:hypothetical protein C8F04DRAFT_1177133 [Mycena alexandri]
MASLLPAAATNPLQAHDAEVDLSENQVPEGVDFGPDVEEGDLPQARDITSCSNDLIKTAVSRFGKSPQKHDPVYESIRQNLWDTLDKRFGFVNPLSSLDRRVVKFAARDPPRSPVDEKLLPVIIGVPDIGPTLASEGLVSILSTFFGQCLEARSAGSIDKLLLDYHRRSEWPSSPFQFTCEWLTSMRTGDIRLYYVLRRHDNGDGSQVLLLPRATDLLEVLRRGWGPDIADVVQHLLARGTTFWLAFMSHNIKQASHTSIRRTHVKREIDSGLGYRPHKHKFTHEDYSVYLALRSDRVMHGPRGRIALQYGGAIVRIARETIADVHFLRQFDEAMYDDGDCLWDGSSEYAYWHEVLSERSEQTTTLSLWPKPHAWVRGTLSTGPWTYQCEEWFRKREGHFASNVFIPGTTKQWRKNMRFQHKVMECLDGYERVAQDILKNLIARSVGTDARMNFD